MKTTRVLAGAILSLYFVAAAQSAEGWYVSLEGGVNAVSDWEHTRAQWTYCGPFITEGTAGFDIGWAAFGGGGLAMGPWRIELEGGYRRSEIGSYLQRGRTRQVDGELSEASLMFNVIYDIPIFERFSLAVGLGAGADFAGLKLNTASAVLDESDWHFAYQGLAGVNYALTEAIIVFANYRYADVDDIKFDPTPLVHVEGNDFEQQTATAGVRFAFNTPSAPAPAAPPATPAPVPLEREFMVFFGFNRSGLSDQALNTIKEAVGAVRESGSAAIRVVGHADRAGSIAYNKALSLRRAQSVQKALIASGISASAITLSGRGESEPMVPTADGVREPQNRRVHISF